MATIDRYYFNVCTDGARLKGIDVDKLLRNAGITPADLATPGWRGSVASMALLVREIWAALSDEYMGYTARPMPVGAFAFASELAASGPTVMQGIERAVRFYNLASPDIATRLSVTPDHTTISASFAEPERDPTRYFSEFWLIIWHRLACWLADEVIPMVEAHFDYSRPDTYFEEFKYLFPCPHRFEASDRAIVLDTRALECPVRRTPQDVQDMIAAAPLALMTVPASDTSLARQVRIVLSQTPSWTSATIARHFGISPDGLRRRLRSEGTSMSRLREYVRRDIATRELRNGSRSVETISSMLGYAEPRSFTRAFRTWTDLSPSEYRAAHAQR